MFLSEAWLHPPQEGAHKKHISRSWQGCGRVDLDSNISSQIDTIPQTSVVRKPSGAPFHLLPPVLDDDHHSLKYPPTWNHWKDEDKPHVDITRKIRGVPRYDFCLIIRSLIPFSSLKFRWGPFSLLLFDWSLYFMSPGIVNVWPIMENLKIK